MTITSVRIYYYSQRDTLQSYLNFTHWGFANWFVRRLKPIREQLRGPEAKGVNIVNFMLGDVGDVGGAAGEWHRANNTFVFNFACDLEPLRDQPPLDNVELLMRFTGAMAMEAPWPQVRAVGVALRKPLSDAEREALLPYLAWPREPWLREAGYEGAALEGMRETARRQMAPLWAEARYIAAGPEPGQ